MSAFVIIPRHSGARLLVVFLGMELLSLLWVDVWSSVSYYHNLSGGRLPISGLGLSLWATQCSCFTWVIVSPHPKLNVVSKPRTWPFVELEDSHRWFSGDWRKGLGLFLRQWMLEELVMGGQDPYLKRREVTSQVPAMWSSGSWSRWSCYDGPGAPWGDGWSWWA